MQIDIGFGDVVYPKPEISELPGMLDFPAPQLLCYSRESAIAEKFEAMVALGSLNSRMVEAFAEPFISAKQTQWTAFRTRLEQDHVPAAFEDIVTQVDRFLSPIVVALTTGRRAPQQWRAPGPWA